MSNLKMITMLCEMLDKAQQIIKGQAQLLAMHGIETEALPSDSMESDEAIRPKAGFGCLNRQPTSAGELEADRARLLAEIEKTI